MQDLTQQLPWLLAKLPASMAQDYDACWDVGNAIKSIAGDPGFEDWKEWALSHKSKHFDSSEKEKHRWHEYANKMDGEIDGLAFLEKCLKADEYADFKPCKLLQKYEIIKAAIGDRLRFNVYKSQIELDGKPLVTDRLYLLIAKDLNISVPKTDAIDIVTDLAESNPYNPVVEYLELVHSRYSDDTRILDDLATRYFGTEHPIYDIYMMRFLIGAVARAMKPGCKMDNLLVLQGKQGIGKSTFLQTLCGADWFDDCFGNLSDKDERMKLTGAWFIEWAEIEATFKRRNIASLKAFITCQEDRLRPPYGYSVKSYPRRCVITATTNQHQFLSDETGNRRFWVIPIAKNIDIGMLKYERDYIWAAAVAAYKAGEQWWLTREEEEIAEGLTQEFQSVDPWEDAIADYLKKFNIITTNEILKDCLHLPAEKRGKGNEMRVANILKQLGWKKTRENYKGSVCRVWKRTNSEVLDEMVVIGCQDEENRYSDCVSGMTTSSVQVDQKLSTNTNRMSSYPGSENHPTNGQLSFLQ
jgi:predicted P-loop ATPase